MLVAGLRCHRIYVAHPNEVGYAKKGAYHDETQKSVTGRQNPYYGGRDCASRSDDGGPDIKLSAPVT